MSDYNAVLQDEIGKFADNFRTPQSEVIIHEPRESQNVAGYAKGCRYGASVTHPDLEKLPVGFSDALKRLDLRFKLDETLKYLESNHPDLYKNIWKQVPMLENLQYDRLQEKQRLQETERWKSKKMEKGYLTKEEEADIEYRESKRNQEFVYVNDRMNKTWDQLSKYIKESAELYDYENPKKDTLERIEKHLEHERPQKKDSYDIYLQTLTDPAKKDSFGLILCDGISSHYMTAAEARQIQRDTPNPQLGTVPENEMLKQPQKNVKCAKAADWFGPVDNMQALRSAFKSLLTKTFGIFAKERSDMVAFTHEDIERYTDKFGNVDLSGQDVTKLPDNLYIKGNLNINNTKITKLPDNLQVDGYLMYDKRIIKLPDNLQVGSNLLKDTNIAILPNNLQVMGYINTKITELPDESEMENEAIRPR